jgi:hypothetical protein
MNPFNKDKVESGHINTLENKSKFDEIDRLPDVDFSMEEIDELPDVVGMWDEIDGLPDVGGIIAVEYKESVEQLKIVCQQIDKMMNPPENFKCKDGKIEPINIPKLKDLKGIVEKCAPSELVKSVTYFSFLRLTMLADYTASIVEHYTGFDVEESYYGEIRDFYAKVVTPEYVKNNFENSNLSPSSIAEGLADITCEAVDAVAYIGAKTLIGVAGVVEDAVTFVVGTVADVAGHPEVAEKLYKGELTDELSQKLDESYDGFDFGRRVGECAEKVGEVGTYIGLSVLAVCETPIVAFAATAGIGIARAGETTREAVEKTGEYTHKELICGAVNGIVAAASVKLIPLINKGIESVASPAAEKILAKFDGEISHYTVEKILGFSEAAIISGGDALIYESQDIVNEFVSTAIGIQDDFEVKWKEVAESVGAGALLGGVLYLLSDVAKDIIKHLDAERTTNLTEVMNEKQGGSYKDVKKTSSGETHEVHHMPADSASPLERNDGPAIKMEKADHRKTASCGSSREAREYQQIQRELIEEGKFLEALQMDIDDIREKFGDKYDDAINEMMEYVNTMIKEGKING